MLIDKAKSFISNIYERLYISCYNKWDNIPASDFIVKPDKKFGYGKERKYYYEDIEPAISSMKYIIEKLGGDWDIDMHFHGFFIGDFYPIAKKDDIVIRIYDENVTISETMEEDGIHREEKTYYVLDMENVDVSELEHGNYPIAFGALLTRLIVVALFISFIVYPEEFFTVVLYPINNLDVILTADFWISKYNSFIEYIHKSWPIVKDYAIYINNHLFELIIQAIKSL